MKKILLFLATVTFLISSAPINAQVTAGSMATDWTLTDINGVSHNLFSYLNAGKTVIIDISATWCGPCWSYHQSGALEDMWVNHGPTGGSGVSSTTTNDVMVFFVEGDASTNSADLHRTGSNTNGDWTANTHHPILDPTNSTTPSVSAFNNLYNLSYFPTCVMICPDHSMQEVDQNTAAQLWTKKQACPASVSNGSDAKMVLSTGNTNLSTCDSIIPTFTLGNGGTTVLTSCILTFKVDGTTQKVKNWTGNLASLATIPITGIKLGAPTTGSHTITVVVSNPNNVTDPTPSNNTTTASFVKYPLTGGAAVIESFENGGLPSAWPITNGGIADTWHDTTVGFNSSKSLKLYWYHIPAGDIDIMGLPSMSFAGASSPTLTFDVAYAQYSTTSNSNDKLEVEVSTNCGTTWTSVYNKAGATLKTKQAAQTSKFTPASAAEWRHETVNLTSYVGQSSVLVHFKGTSDYGNNVYVDNINVNGLGTTTGIQENEMPDNINVYPNPLNDNATVEFNLAKTSDVSILMYNLLGESVLSNKLGEMNAGMHSLKLDGQNFNSGIYFITLNAGNNKITKKVIINK